MNECVHIVWMKMNGFMNGLDTWLRGIYVQCFGKFMSNPFNLWINMHFIFEREEREKKRTYISI